MDREILLQRKITPATKNAFGEVEEAWGDLGVFWAEKLEVRAGEAVRAEEEAATISLQFKIWFPNFQPQVNPRDRLIYPEGYGLDLAFNISGVQEIGRRVGLLISCWARADQAATQAGT